MAKWKTPKEYPKRKKEEKRPFSGRIRIGNYEYLQRQAEKGGQSLGELLEYVLDDYCEWLRKNG